MAVLNEKAGSWMNDEQKMIVALWQCWNQMNAIRARDGTAYHGPDNYYSGRIEYVSEKTWNDIVEDARATLGAHAQPWAPEF